MNVPEQLRYSSDHEWVSRDGDVVRVGITDYAQDALGDVVFVQVPDGRRRRSRRATRSARSRARSRCPTSTPRSSGTVVEVNEALADAPAVAQRRPLRRRLDLRDPDERPGRVRRAARRGGLPGAHRGLSVAYVFCNQLRSPQPARQQLLLELRLAARRPGRPHDHAHRGRPAAGRARAPTTTSSCRWPSCPPDAAVLIVRSGAAGRRPLRARRRP